MSNTPEVQTSKFVYYVSLIFVLCVVGIGLMLPVQFGSFTGSVFTFLTKYMGWWYMLAVNFFVIFCIVLAFSRFGSLRMGKPDEKPEFSTMSWFAMLFGAGHGVGMVFYGVAEPLINYIVRPFGATDSAQAAEDALREGYAGVRPLPAVSDEVFEGMVAGRNLLLVDDLLEQQNADLRAFIPKYTAGSVRRLRAWLDTGRYRREPT